MIRKWDTSGIPDGIHQVSKMGYSKYPRWNTSGIPDGIHQVSQGYRMVERATRASILEPTSSCVFNDSMRSFPIWKIPIGYYTDIKEVVRVVKSLAGGGAEA
jgi:hypothetical protein